MSPDPLSLLAAARILVVGDVMLDVFVRGDVARISPEAPVPVLRARAAERTLGGAGNVARNVIGLGARALFVGVIGDDEPGREVLRLFDAEGPRMEAEVTVDPARPTTRKERFVSSLLSTHLLRVDWEEAAEPAPGLAARLRAGALDALADADALVLSDYAKGVVTPALAQALIAAARSAGKFAIVDPKGADYARYAGASLLTPNKAELAQAAGVARFADEAGLISAAQALIARHDLGAILVTRGEEGATLVTAEGAASAPPAARFVRDVSGAGDTVTAVAAAALAAGLSLAEAARLAMAAAGAVVERPGAAAVSAGELAAALARQAAPDGAAKTTDRAGACARAAAWKAAGLTVGFTNGCFDVLHAGHVSLLRQARAACDRLIVGLNDDASVRRLKGASRPVNRLEDRAAVLAALADVDCVTAFAEDTPLALIEALVPDVLVKGADYALDQVVGRAAVEAAGGRVVLATLTPGLSTTALVGRLRD